MAAGEKVVWVSLDILRLLPHDLDLDKWHKNAWMDR